MPTNKPQKYGALAKYIGVSGLLDGGRAFVDYMMALVDSITSGAVYWAQDETTGSVAYVYNTALATGRNVLIDGDMETVGVAAWTAVSSATLTKETGTPHGGSNVLRVAYGGTAIPRARQAIVQQGRSYRVQGYARGDGTFEPSVNLGTVVIWTGTSSTSWQAFDTTQTVSGSENIDLKSNANAAGYVEFDDVTVTQTDILASSAYPGAELLTDGDMEAADTSAWTVGANATVTKETGTPHGGSRVLRVARSISNNPYTFQTVLTIGKRYRATGYMRGDGTAQPKIGDIGGGGPVTGTTSTAWQAFDITWTALATSWVCQAVTTTGTTYAEFDDVSVTEVNPLNGAYTGVTLAQPFGSLDVAPLYDGANDYTDVYSNTLNSFFNPSAGTLLCFAQVSAAGVWTDGTYDYLASLNANGSYLAIHKATVNNRLDFVIQGSAEKRISKTSISETGIMMLALTWDVSANQVKAFYNGVQEGSTLTSPGTWTGNLSSTLTTIGASSTTPTSVWSGLDGHVLLAREALTPAQILTIAQQAGVA